MSPIEWARPTGCAMTLDLQGQLNRLALTDGLGAAGAANAWAGTTGLEVVGALNALARAELDEWPEDQDLAGVCNALAGTDGLDAPGALATIETPEPE